jgi:hypothetical protein
MVELTHEIWVEVDDQARSCRAAASRAPKETIFVSSWNREPVSFIHSRPEATMRQ